MGKGKKNPKCLGKEIQNLRYLSLVFKYRRRVNFGLFSKLKLFKVEIATIIHVCEVEVESNFMTTFFFFFNWTMIFYNNLLNKIHSVGWLPHSCTD